MFEDILGKDNRYVKTVTWVLSINEKDYDVEVFNVGKNEEGGMEGYIKDKEHEVNMYTNYALIMPEMPHRVIKVIIIRVNKDTLKFYVPSGW